MTVQSRSRVRAVSAFVVIVISLGASFLACDEAKRSNGEECLKSFDCLSGNCSSMRCVASPPLLEGTPSSDAAVTESGSIDGGGNDSSGGADTGGDTSTGSDANGDGDGPGVDAPADAPKDVIDAMNDVDFPDGPGDAQPDVLAAALDVSDDALGIPDALGG
jgi:hypothetical protein